MGIRLLRWMLEERWEGGRERGGGDGGRGGDGDLDQL